MRVRYVMLKNVRVKKREFRVMFFIISDWRLTFTTLIS